MTWGIDLKFDTLTNKLNFGNSMKQYWIFKNNFAESIKKIKFYEIKNVLNRVKIFDTHERLIDVWASGV